MNSRSNARAGTSQPGRLAARRRKPHFFALLVASVVVVAVILSLGGSKLSSSSRQWSLLGPLPWLAWRGPLKAIPQHQSLVHISVRLSPGVEPTFQLSDAPEATVQQFLVLHAEGSLEQFEVASADALAKLDGVRGRDVFAYWQWHEVTGQQAFGTKRPDGVPAQVVNLFLETFKADGFEPSRWREFELFRREALLDTRYGKSSVPPIAGKRSTSTPNHGQLSFLIESKEVLPGASRFPSQLLAKALEAAAIPWKRYDGSLRAAVEEQAIQRVHRIGVYFLVMFLAAQENYGPFWLVQFGPRSAPAVQSKVILAVAHIAAPGPSKITCTYGGSARRGRTSELRHSLPEFSSYRDWPPCLRLCGLLPCDADEPEIPELAVDLTEDEGARVEIDLTLDETSGNPDCFAPRFDPACAMSKDGSVIVFTDGACRDNQTPALRNAGVGAFWHTDHAMNINEPLLGHAQTNHRAELTAMIRVLQTDPRSLDIRADSKYVHDGCVHHISKWRANSLKSGSREISNKDLWLQLDCLLCCHTKVKDHSRDADVKAGRTSSFDKWGNDAADKLAAGPMFVPANLSAASYQANPELILLRQQQQQKQQQQLQEETQQRQQQQQQKQEQKQQERQQKQLILLQQQQEQKQQLTAAWATTAAPSCEATSAEPVSEVMHVEDVVMHEEVEDWGQRLLPPETMDEGTHATGLPSGFEDSSAAGAFEQGLGPISTPVAVAADLSPPFVEAISQPWAAPAWEAEGESLFLSSACTGFAGSGFDEDEDELSDSDLLAACEAVEAQEAASMSQVPAASTFGDVSTSGIDAAACWAAMPLDEA
ncbi:unnamed protein product [Polarella glacialis]|uniref:ribonuclease H n=1 Tax=Polarella glacialis TaxID=89957 RepID=A0A813M062_POLGL|nr:unnamed protein product [Polarella glacialis]